MVKLVNEYLSDDESLFDALRNLILERVHGSCFPAALIVCGLADTAER